MRGPDLKVLETGGPAAALSARKWMQFSLYVDYLQPAWVTYEEFGMSFTEIKAQPVHVPSQNGLVGGVSQGEWSGRGSTVNQQPESGGKNQLLKTKPPDGRMDNISSKPDQRHPKSNGSNPSDAQPYMSTKPMDQKKARWIPQNILWESYQSWLKLFWNRGIIVFFSLLFVLS